MTQPIPEHPINVQETNPYVGLDRGMFYYRTPGMQRPARIHAARWMTKGPGASTGVLEFQIMAYNSKPVSEAQYGAGELVKAPDGSTWFDCLVRGGVFTPIMVEYWATQSYYMNYVAPDGKKLTQDEKDNALMLAATFVETMGKFAGLQTVDLSISYNAVNGKPLSRTDITFRYSHVDKAGKVHEVDLSDDFLDVSFDPVRVALQKIQSS